ncbi:hypothetical protein EJ071_15665 [Mesorhizobium sp. M1B.F.Ca.ET.045.04.1.1]|nr:hypothetical protein EJ071_15665 [Mesorhizobium sp. M1B.F.Ca.ET.045.04.1.1]RWB17903.1 MAG: hypothetical protein EOQ40_24765 [Mesorhizobium sp.]
MADGFPAAMAKHRRVRPLMSSILIIQTKYIGDMVLTSALVRSRCRGKTAALSLTTACAPPDRQTRGPFASISVPALTGAISPLGWEHITLTCEYRWPA